MSLCLEELLFLVYNFFTMRLYKNIKSYCKKSIVPMHMPGHKRRVGVIKNSLPYDIDITEIDTFDNLQNPQGILKNCLEKSSKVFGSYRSFYSVNGGSCGVLVALKSYCNIGDKIILTRNCHKSVYNLVELLNLRCVYLDVKTDEYGILKQVEFDEIKQTVLENLDAKCVIITSPTYEGVISNVQKIANFLHKNNIPLIVDEAHGAHLFLRDSSALQKGADIVLNSLHKTLPSLTQTALIHIGKKALNKEIVAEKVANNLSIFQTTSPSYVLMSSIDECVEFLSKKGKKSFANLQENLAIFKQNVEGLKHLKIIGYNVKSNYFEFDNTKIVISTKNTNINGAKLMEMLRKNKIECEMYYNDYVLAMVTIFDTNKNLKYFAKVLKDIDSRLVDLKMIVRYFDLPKPEIVLSVCDARNSKKRLVNLKDAKGKVVAEYVYAYPPGSPILVPGERLTKDVLYHLEMIKVNNTVIRSTSNNIDNDQIFIVDD